MCWVLIKEYIILFVIHLLTCYCYTTSTVHKSKRNEFSLVYSGIQNLLYFLFKCLCQVATLVLAVGLIRTASMCMYFN